ncbi:MAG: PDZ domain-containing protein, partial [Bacteroidetes bacterium]|nr:PDZ domain-containing protein [Bacteroidota bacterium]
EKIKSDWLIDTGASQAISLFTEDLSAPEKSIDAFLGMGLSGGVYGKLGRVQAFSLGEFTFEDVITGFPDTASLNILAESNVWYGNLGAEIISRFHVVFDYPRGSIYLRKNSNFRKDFRYNISGIELLTSGEDFDKYVVSYVRPDSPAEEADVQINDEILSINGIDVEKLNIDELYGTLGYKNRKVITLRLKRDGEAFRVRFRLISEI